MKRPVTALSTCTAVVGLSLALFACAGPSKSERDHSDIVTLETSAGDITVELDRAGAPVTVENFLGYMNRSAYDGTTIHRIVPGFVIQGGGWTPDLQERAKLDAAAGKPDKPIRNEWQNGLKNTRGTIAMAREKDPDSATREFFINLADNAKLDTPREVSGGAGYAVFGRVISGMEVVDRIAAVSTRSVDVPGVTDGSMQNVPVESIVIRRVRLGTQR
ncbi:MAG: peptidylprolyl isomerase [Phycisphaerales bacterium]|nr:peptidylprolyl isomerase [Phycisphaerales bacterium]